MNNFHQPDVNHNCDMQFKIAVMGDGGVGKTALIYRYMYDKFYPNTPMTRGVILHSFQINTQQNGDQIPIGVKIWDFSGQELNYARLPGFIEGTQAAILAFDLTAFHTLTDLREWYRALEEYAGKVPLVLVGTKSDQAQENTAVSINEETIQQFSAELGAESFIETSAKTGLNIQHLFTPLIRTVINQCYAKEDPIITD